MKLQNQTNVVLHNILYNIHFCFSINQIFCPCSSNLTGAGIVDDTETPATELQCLPLSTLILALGNPRLVTRDQTPLLQSYSVNQCCGSGSGLIRSFWVTQIRIQEKPDPDPLSTKRTLKFKISPRIKLSKIQFHPNNFLSLILSVIRYLDLVRKSHKKKYFFLLNIKNISKQDPVIFGSPGSGSVFEKPDPWIWIRKKLTGSATLVSTTLHSDTGTW